MRKRIWLAAALSTSLAACATAPDSRGVGLGYALGALDTATRACGTVRPWPAEFQQHLADEIDHLPADSALRTLAADAIDARDAVRTCRGKR